MLNISVEEIGVRSATLTTIATCVVSIPMDYAWRFWPKVDKRGPDECWPWKQSLNRPSGYGQFDYKGKDGKRVKKNASRVAFELTFGPLPSDILVRHSCDNPPCCNPAHLLAGSTADNQDDMSKRGRSCRGEKNCKAKLTDLGVIQIRRRLEAGCSGTEIAKEHGISKATVSDIKHRRIWKHL